MITLRKLLSMKRSARLRKIAVILQDAEQQVLRGMSPDGVYVRDIARLLQKEEGVPQAVYGGCRELLQSGALPEGEPLLRALNRIRHGLLSCLGAEPADWDLWSGVPACGDVRQSSGRSVFPFRVFLDDIRSPFNVGSIFRTAESFAVERIFLSEDTPDPEHPRAVRTAMGTTKIVPYERINLGSLADEAVFALEVGGIPLEEFPFPAGGTVIIGSEELGVSPEGRMLADRSCGRVSIPTAGTKGSLNVSVAFGILMQAWYSRRRGGS